MSADALAKEVGYSSQSGISNLENRAVGRGGFKLPDIAKALDFSLEWFLNGPDVEDMSQVPSFYHLDISKTYAAEPEGKYKTTRQQAHDLIDQLSELGVEKAISMLEVIATAHPRTTEDSAGVRVPATTRYVKSARAR